MRSGFCPLDRNTLQTCRLSAGAKHYFLVSYNNLEDGKGTISHVNEYTYLGVRITKDGNGEPEINDGINRGRAAITKLNDILWDCDVTSKTKTNIYHAVVKSTMTHAAET